MAEIRLEGGRVSDFVRRCIVGIRRTGRCRSGLPHADATRIGPDPRRRCQRAARGTAESDIRLLAHSGPSTVQDEPMRIDREAPE
jgi:hypothetical protein